MLPPDFHERKRAAQKKSALTRFLNRLREGGVEPDSFPHHPLPESEEQPLHDAVAPWLHIQNREVEKVSGWDAVSHRVAAWAVGEPEIAVFFNDGDPTGWLVVPGGIVSTHVDVFWKAAARHFLFLVTPDAQAGVMYFEDEHENVFGIWGDA